MFKDDKRNLKYIERRIYEVATSHDIIVDKFYNAGEIEPRFSFGRKNSKHTCVRSYEVIVDILDEPNMDKGVDDFLNAVIKELDGVNEPEDSKCDQAFDEMLKCVRRIGYLQYGPEQYFTADIKVKKEFGNLVCAMTEYATAKGWSMNEILTMVAKAKKER